MIEEQACRAPDKNLLKELIYQYNYIEDVQELMLIIMTKTRGQINPQIIDDLIIEIRGKNDF